MALDFQKINSSDLIFSLDDVTLNLIEKPVDEFNRVYNNIFDYYGKFRLYNNHQEYLREVLLPLKSKSQTIHIFISLLDECIDTGVVLIGIGD